MKNKKFWLGMLVLTLVFGMTVIGCGEDEDTPEEDTTTYIPPTPQPGDTASDPINRAENINLGTMTSSTEGWQQLLNSIESTRKYINLDLSACTMTGTSFNPVASVFKGKQYIVSIILPTVATSIIESEDNLGAAFSSFSSLKSISGASITTIGKYAFYSCRKLQSADFPQVTTIGESSFRGCDGLATLNIPKVTSIGGHAFAYTGNTALTITMGTNAPSFPNTSMFFDVSTTTKQVKVKVPSGATGYTPFTGTSVTVSGADKTANWANGFRGGSWNGHTWAWPDLANITINQNISLTIERQ